MDIISPTAAEVSQQSTCDTSLVRCAHKQTEAAPMRSRCTPITVDVCVHSSRNLVMDNMRY